MQRLKLAGGALMIAIVIAWLAHPKELVIAASSPAPISPTIQKLIQCESGGLNISRPDSDGLISDGILQYHRGPGDRIDTGTWGTWSKESGITGDPRYPADAIRMTEWAIAHGHIGAWSCAHILHLVK